jgi:alanine racemase
VRQNALSLARKAAPAAFCAVIKSNAYGHGLLPVARAIAGAGIARLSFGVFAIGEALELREAGIADPIVVLGPIDDGDLGRAAERGIECALLSADDISRFAHHRLRIHIKVDTGLSRFGIAPSQGAAVAAACADAGLKIAGMYSHLANAEELGKSFVFEQTRRLLSASASMPYARHIAASAAAILWPETRLDMVRCGIALYGRWPSAEVRAMAPDLDLKPALRWFVPVAQVRKIETGDAVGYGCEFVADRPTTIAVLALGYADGLPRIAGGSRGGVILHGKRVPIVGRVCMNACMVDVTDVPHAARGDVAEIDVADVAAATGTIEYEILARLPQSVERRFA